MPTGTAVPLLVQLLAACCLTAWSLEHFGFFTFYFLFAASARSSIGSASFVNFLYVTMFAFYLLSCLLSAIRLLSCQVIFIVCACAARSLSMLYMYIDM